MRAVRGRRPAPDAPRLFDDEGLYEITPSKLQCWLDCARQFRFRYVEHRPGRRAFTFTSMGLSVHRALRDFYAAPPAGRSLDFLLRLLRRFWDPSGFSSQDEAEAIYTKAEDMMRRFFESTDHAAVRPLALESKFSRAEPELGVLVTGRVDRLDHSPDGWVIVDYKTGTYRQDQESVDASLPLSLYAMAVGGQLDRVGSRIVLHHLASGKKVETVRDTVRLEQDRAALGEVAATIRSERRYTPAPGPLCRWCDFLYECPEGRAEVERRGQ